MFKHILIATDGTALSDGAVAAGLQLAQALGAKVSTVTAIDPYPYGTLAAGAEAPEGYLDRMRREAGRRLTNIAALGSVSGVTPTPFVKETTQPYRAIIEVAQQNNCDLIFMASHGRHGLQALLLGSETQKVLAHSTIPVIVYR